MRTPDHGNRESWADYGRFCAFQTSYFRKFMGVKMISNQLQLFDLVIILHEYVRLPQLYAIPPQWSICCVNNNSKLWLYEGTADHGNRESWADDRFCAFKTLFFHKFMGVEYDSNEHKQTNNFTTWIYSFGGRFILDWQQITHQFPEKCTQFAYRYVNPTGLHTHAVTSQIWHFS